MPAHPIADYPSVHIPVSRRLAVLAVFAAPMAACAEPRAQVDERRTAPPRIVDPKTELERGRGR